MELLVIRHGVAEDREEYARQGKDDSLRPLTDEGRWKMERVARGLRHVVPSLDLVATSPFVRAEQTARIVAAAYDDADVIHVDTLTPDGVPDEFLAWLGEHRSAGHVAAVGHEPHLGALVAWLVTGQWAEGRIALRKGGACLVELEGERLRAGEGRLLWLLTPAVLRKLAE